MGPWVSDRLLVRTSMDKFDRYLLDYWGKIMGYFGETGKIIIKIMGVE